MKPETLLELSKKSSFVKLDQMMICAIYSAEDMKGYFSKVIPEDAVGIVSSHYDLGEPEEFYTITPEDASQAKVTNNCIYITATLENRQVSIELEFFVSMQLENV